MAGAFSPEQRPANWERGFEFCRLHEQWMAAAYALVVPGRAAGPRESAPGVAPAPSKPAPDRRPDDTDRRAG
jgi:hypothetical protein